MASDIIYLPVNEKCSSELSKKKSWKMTYLILYSLTSLKEDCLRHRLMARKKTSYKSGRNKSNVDKHNLTNYLWILVTFTYISVYYFLNSLLLSRPSTLRVSAMKSSRSLPSPWTRTRPSPCPMWCLTSGSWPTRGTPTAWWSPRTLWWKETTLRSPPPSSAPPLRDWSTSVWASWTRRRGALCWAPHLGWWGFRIM